MTARDGGIVLGTVVVGGGVGYGLSLWSRRAAQAAVNVRPSLADVGPLDAALSNHGTDWLYYQYPMVMSAISVIIMAVVCAAFAYMTVTS